MGESNVVPMGRHCPLCEIWVPIGTDHSCSKTIAADLTREQMLEAIRVLGFSLELKKEEE